MSTPKDDKDKEKAGAGAGEGTQGDAKKDDEPKSKKLTVKDILPESWARKDSELVVTVDGRKVNRSDVAAK